MSKNVPVSRRKFVVSALSAAALGATPPPAFSAPVSRAADREPQLKLTPYLLFDGTCADAMRFYQSVFGGELNVSKVKDSVMKNQMPPFQQDKVLNARLQSAGVEFSASDWLRPDEARVRGNTVCLYLRGGTRPQLKTLFEKLSDGAQVTDPLKAQPFGTYGALNDKFGVRWMFWTDENGA